MSKLSSQQLCNVHIISFPFYWLGDGGTERLSNFQKSHSRLVVKLRVNQSSMNTKTALSSLFLCLKIVGSWDDTLQRPTSFKHREHQEPLAVRWIGQQGSFHAPGLLTSASRGQAVDPDPWEVTIGHVSSNLQPSGARRFCHIQQQYIPSRCRY